MAAFDANPAPDLHKERSAFEDDDGDLGSDMDDAEAPQLGKMISFS